MQRILSVDDLVTIIKKHSLENCFIDLIEFLKEDLMGWDKFDKMPRPAFHVKDGVIELMPICGKGLFSYKCVNGHPKNPENFTKQTVVAIGSLLQVDDGYPVLISEMTLLTALRTAVTSVLMSNYLANKNSKVLSLIGTGAQSDFQLLAHLQYFKEIEEVYYFDTDQQAMDRFYKNMKDKINPNIKLIASSKCQDAVTPADIIIVCTACKGHVDVIKNDWLKQGVHINALGGDCPGKTEIQLDILKRDDIKIVVEHFEQSFIEGEIQRFSHQQAKELIYAHCFEVIQGLKKPRENEKEITLFDSVGFALEDYSALRWLFELAQKYNIGQKLQMTPNLQNPKDLYCLFFDK